jgi:hypothetical protein
MPMAGNDNDLPDWDFENIYGLEALEARRHAETQALCAQVLQIQAWQELLLARWDAQDAARAPQQASGERAS